MDEATSDVRQCCKCEDPVAAALEAHPDGGARFRASYEQRFPVAGRNELDLQESFTFLPARKDVNATNADGAVYFKYLWHTGSKNRGPGWVGGGRGRFELPSAPFDQMLRKLGPCALLVFNQGLHVEHWVRGAARYGVCTGHNRSQLSADYHRQAPIMPNLHLHTLAIPALRSGQRLPGTHVHVLA